MGSPPPYGINLLPWLREERVDYAECSSTAASTSLVRTRLPPEGFPGHVRGKWVKAGEGTIKQGYRGVGYLFAPHVRRFRLAFSIASVSLSFATISSGRYFFRRLFAIESLLACSAVDLLTGWIRISKAGQWSDERLPVRQQEKPRATSVSGLPFEAIDHRSLHQSQTNKTF